MVKSPTHVTVSPTLAVKELGEKTRPRDPPKLTTCVCAQVSSPAKSMIASKAPAKNLPLQKHFFSILRLLYKNELLRFFETPQAFDHKTEPHIFVCYAPHQMACTVFLGISHENEELVAGSGHFNAQ
jgi:hypothetical protein